MDKTLVFVLNGKIVELDNIDPSWTVQEYLRSQDVHLTGSKLVCGEGGCGACTVAIARRRTRSIEKSSCEWEWIAVNSCLFPLAALQGCYLVTVEGIHGESKNDLHLIQKELAEGFASQCGFCTPGMVMALYAEKKNSVGKETKNKDIEDILDGNLCRCTGYRPIIDSAKLALCDGKGGCGSVDLDKTFVENEQKALDYLIKLPIKSQKFEFKSEYSLPQKILWFSPRTFDELLKIKKEYLEVARLIVGSTEISVEKRLKNGIHFPEVALCPSKIEEMNQVTLNKENGCLEVGAAVNLTRLDEECGHLISSPTSVLSAFQKRSLRAIRKQLKTFASNQIRNVACLGGNLATASPSSDMNPVLLSLRSVLNVFSFNNEKEKREAREVPVEKFFLGYRKVDLKPEEIIGFISIPLTMENEHVFTWKVSKRVDDDICIITGSFWVKFVKAKTSASLSCCSAPASSVDFVIEDCMFAFSGMSFRTIYAPLTREYLKGKQWNSSLFPKVYEILDSDVHIPLGAPGGMASYRNVMSAVLFYKFFLSVNKELGLELSTDEESMLRELKEDRKSCQGVQEVHENPSKGPVGKSVAHLCARIQTTGEALYTDDLPEQSRELQGAFVLSTKAHAKIVSVDPSEALKLPGVIDFIDYHDIPGLNDVGPTARGEELFATERVVCVGFPVGLIIAVNYNLAIDASLLVKIEYEELPKVITIQDAIDAKSYFEPAPFYISRGNLENGFSESDVVFEDSFEVEGQEQFYLEPNVSLAHPGENSEFKLYCSTQNPTRTQSMVAQVLNIPSNRVVVHMKRMGGGFGGKETRSMFISAAAAVAAHKLKRAVRIRLDRATDMAITGQRHSFLGRFKVGYMKTGKINAVDMKLYSNAGHSIDLSQPVMERALFHASGAYFIPHFRAEGFMCKTNRPSNTAFRGFGAPQGLMMCEHFLERIAFELGFSPEFIRERNMYLAGQLTPYLQEVPDDNLSKCWNQIKVKSDYEAREKAISEFNSNNRFKKKGISLLPVMFGCSFTLRFLNQAGALVNVYFADGSVLVSHAGTEMGQGLHTKMGQIVAQAFDIPLELVHITDTCTDKVPNTSPTSASVQADINGMAILDACNQINARLQPLREENPNISWQDLVKKAWFSRICLSAEGFYATPNVGYDFQAHEGKPFAYFSNGVACSEVEVDLMTGEYNCLRSDILFDIGDTLNPGIDIGQIEGAFVQGVGWCTIEQLLTFPDGTMFTNGPGNYKIPGFKDIPEDFRVSILRDAPNPQAVHSSKGIGEPPLFLGTSVYFAIKKALMGAQQKQLKYISLPLPATCERIRLSVVDEFVSFANSTSDSRKEKPKKWTLEI